MIGVDLIVERFLGGGEGTRGVRQMAGRGLRGGRAFRGRGSGFMEPVGFGAQGGEEGSAHETDKIIR